MFSQPSVVFHAGENCVVCEDEGTITNLDPNFLVPRDLLHSDGIFSWMTEAKKIGILENADRLPTPHINDIISDIGGVRNLRKGIAALVKSWSLERTGRNDLRNKVLTEFCSSVGITENLSTRHLALACATQFIGPTREADSLAMLAEVRAGAKGNPEEFRKLRARLASNFEDVFSRQIGILDEYAKGYDQFSQTLIYAIRETPPDGDMVASAMDLRAVKMFYGNCFEQLAAGFDLPACINNIIKGRSFDQFELMNLQKYLAINKANRASPFVDNPRFSVLHAEFDSTLRNASHHGALRVCSTKPELLEYRSGDNGTWKRISFVDYLLRCNKIMICMMQLLLLQVAVLESLR